MNITEQASESNKVIKRHELSMGQKALWFIHSFGGAAQSAYNESLVYSISGFFSVSVLNSAFNALLMKHPGLRVSFETDTDGIPCQVVNEQTSIRISIIDDIDEPDIEEYITEAIMQPFDLTKAPLMRVSLIKRNAMEWNLVIVLHHLITDGTSLGILVKDLNYFYNHFLNGEMVLDHQKTSNWADIINFEKKNISSSIYQEKVAHFSETLQGYSGLNFLTTPIHSEKPDIFSGERVYFTLDKQLCAQARDFSRGAQVSLFHFLFAAYSIFIGQYTRSQDIVIGVPFANRSHDQNEQVGYFVNTLPVRVTLDPVNTFDTFVTYVRNVMISCLTKQDIAFEHIASRLHLDRKAAGQHPLIQTMFVWSQHLESLNLGFDNISAKLEQGYYSKTSKFDVSLFMLEENKESVIAYFEYRSDLFDRPGMERFAANFVTLIKNILTSHQRPMSALTMLDPAEKQRMKEKLFVSRLDRNVVHSLASLFSETASLYGNKTGLIFQDRHYNYDTLEARSNQWASYIRFQYTRIYGTPMPADTLIGLCVDRHEDMIFGILGILKSGAAYVPIDPRYPAERIEFMIDDSKMALLLTHQDFQALNIQYATEQVIYMDDDSILLSEHFQNILPTHVINPKDVAYVLYTSGSTGKPKGVSVSHENIICLFESLKKQFALSHKDILSLFHTYCFDISVWEIWGAFLFGGTLVVVPYDVSRDPKRLYQLLEFEQVSVLKQTPSAFQMLVNEDLAHNKKLEKLRYVAFVGESLKVSILRPWAEKYGTQSPRLANMYGITETTVYTNYKFVEQADIDKGRDNIGWPLEEFSMCIMNDELQWCPVGIIGEICIGGRGLSRGYLNRDDLTAEKFVQDPYAEFLNLEKGARLYRTGDLGRWLEDGSIEYHGRKDFQIKLRGFRIELGEIESALGSYEGISHTVVLLKGEAESAYLAAWYTVKPDSKVDVLKLRLHLKSFLPDYMIPGSFTELPSFPMTANGKINRKELDTYQVNSGLKKEIVKLNTPLQQKIANIWAQVLKTDSNQIGLVSNFFELGGNSLLVIHMLSLVSKQLGCDVPVSQFMGLPTIETLSAQVENKSPDMGFHSLLKRLKTDVILDDAIQVLPEVRPPSSHPKNILLTGATGFLGAHILHELLETTEATIYCLVRAASTSKGLQNIMDKLAKFRLSTEKNIMRIIPVLGDLSAIKLGLSSHSYQHLADNIDSIYHVGAWVHHIFDYETLYKTNVEATREILRIATHAKNKSIHFISTLNTQLLSITEESRELTPLDFNGYLSSKWVSEQLLAEAARRGINAYVYRPGNIVAGISQGVCEPEMNHTLLRLKGMLQLKKAYIDNSEMLEMMPVDLLASVIVTISHKPERFSYNLHNSDKISWIDYLSIIKKRGYSFDLIDDVQEWNDILDALDEQNALYKLACFYKVNPSVNQQMAKQKPKILADYIISTPSYSDLIEKQIDYLIHSGFLDHPNCICEPTSTEW